MRRRFTVASAMVGAVALMTLAGCTTDPSVTDSSAEPESSEEASVEWFDQALFDKQNAERTVVPEGPDGQPWLQTINAELVDTAQYASTARRRPASRTPRSRTPGGRPAGSP